MIWAAARWREMRLRMFFLYLMALGYAVAGVNHFVHAASYTPIIPHWLPYPDFLVFASGLAEIGLGILLIPATTRIVSAWLIIAMLVVFFFLIHIPMSIDYWQKNSPSFWITIARLPVQFILIWWAWKYTQRPAV
jgi:uncharacterized membrane protein